MKIVFEKGINAYQMMEYLKKFILEQAEDYPILKNDMVVNIALRNNINQINPNNERMFTFTKKDMDENEEKQKRENLRYADLMFEEQWGLFTLDCSDSIIREIERDKKYLATAEEMGRSLQNIEKRKKTLEKNKKRLEQEYKQLRLIAPYVEMYEKGQVDFEYKNEVCYDILTDDCSIEIVKIMNFDNGDIFVPDATCIGEAYIKNKDGKVIVGNKK